MSSQTWQETLTELSETLSDIQLDMCGTEEYCIRGFEALLSRSMVLSILEVCEEGEDPRVILQSLKARLDHEMTTAMALIEKRKH